MESGRGFSGDLETKRHVLMEKMMVMIKLHKMYLERELNQSGVFRSQHQILMYIARNPDASQREIAEHQHVSTATIAVSLKKLEKGGYIIRSADQLDNRFNQIRITPKGQAVVEKSGFIFRRAEEAQFCGFGQDELSQLQDYLDRMRLNLEYLLQEPACPWEMIGNEESRQEESHETV